MLPETRRAALRAASIIAGVAACSPAPPPQAQTVPASDVPAKDLGATAGNGAGNGSGTEATPSPAQCERIVDDAYPGQDKYPFDTEANVAPVVRACCVQAMSTPEGRASALLARHRWDCCGATAKLPIATGSFCIPWGPPVPPPMARRPRRISDCSLDLV